jgi:hypothetical protein
MVKYVVLLGVLAFAAPGMAVADDNQNNNSGAQNSNGLPFTANDPPADTFHGPPSLPPGLGGTFPPGCTVLAADKDDKNGPNGDDNHPHRGNPNCQPASP